ncbi:type IX secretion system membrane protein PorP/SprF [Emticicia agri]|uniref:Type IX secretion system membrane protein PorP/SprF n=1 Tax=Emticicia agri TaxID=2492393 RepID=A0A4Q5LVV3_9BACT|nr:type IX secretion system membrane protein PorP/SprF [Emticicia agri]RYU93866.1 type IX secretion system membrane protein PorP/SprF [Emticicia agri]
MKYTSITILLTLIQPVFAQNTLRPNIYLGNLNFYNAGAGLNDDTHNHYLSLYLKDKFVPQENNAVWTKPLNIYLNYLGNINQKSFFNLSYIHDGYSFYNKHTLYGGYGRKYELGKGRISFGLRAVIDFNYINWETLGALQVASGKSLRVNPNLDFGLFYQRKGLILSFSGKNLFSNEVKKDNETLIKNWQEFYFNASYKLNLFKENLAITPFLLYFKERNMDIDVGLNMALFKTLDMSYALRILELRSIYTARLSLGKRLQIGAAFDHSALLSDTNVDFLLGYRF